MATAVFIVTEGEYSDYAIKGAALDLDAAKALVRRLEEDRRRWQHETWGRQLPEYVEVWEGRTEEEMAAEHRWYAPPPGRLGLHTSSQTDLVIEVWPLEERATIPGATEPEGE